MATYSVEEALEVKALHDAVHSLCEDGQVPKTGTRHYHKDSELRSPNAHHDAVQESSRGIDASSGAPSRPPLHRIWPALRAIAIALKDMEAAIKHTPKVRLLESYTHFHWHASNQICSMRGLDLGIETDSQADSGLPEMLLPGAKM